MVEAQRRYMNETDKQLAAEIVPGKRPPVAWMIASVTNEAQSVTVIFPMAPDTGSANAAGTQTAQGQE